MHKEVGQKARTLGHIYALSPSSKTDCSLQKMMPKAQMPLMGTQAASNWLQGRKEGDQKSLSFLCFYVGFSMTRVM